MISAEVVGMGVSEKHASQIEPSFGGFVGEPERVPCGVDDHGSTALGIGQEIHEVPARPDSVLTEI